jgi:hypothetical protein
MLMANLATDSQRAHSEGVIRRIPASHPSHRYILCLIRSIAAIAILGIIVFPSAAATLDCERGLRRDYGYPAGAIVGERLRALIRNIDSQVVSSLPESQRSNALEEYHRLREQKLARVKAVRSEIEKAYRSFSKERQARVRSEYEATMRDISNIEERAQYGFAYVDPTDKTQKILVFGQKQITEWSQGMLSWGVAYISGVWPRAFFTNMTELAALGACKITAGDWEGAWLLENGMVFVPGLRFLSEMEISIEQQDAGPAHAPKRK